MGKRLGLFSLIDRQRLNSAFDYLSINILAVCPRHPTLYLFDFRTRPTLDQFQIFFRDDACILERVDKPCL